MRIPEARLRSLIKHVLLRENLKKMHANDPDAPLGKYAFAPERDKDWWEAEEEPDTEFEDQLYKKLVGHIIDNTPIDNNSAEVAAIFAQYGDYVDAFALPKDVKHVYRGVALSEQELSYYGLTPAHFTDEWVDWEQRHVVTPTEILSMHTTRTTSSWSKSQDIAKYFARRSSRHQRPFEVVFRAPVDPMWMLDLEPLYSLNGTLWGMRREKEVICVKEVVYDMISLRCLYKLS